MTQRNSHLTRSRVRIALALMLIGLLVVFALQNTAPVELRFLDWTIQSRRIVVIGLSFAIGLAVGGLVRLRV